MTEYAAGQVWKPSGRRCGRVILAVTDPDIDIHGRTKITWGRDKPGVVERHDLGVITGIHCWSRQFDQWVAATNAQCVNPREATESDLEQYRLAGVLFCHLVAMCPKTWTLSMTQYYPGNTVVYSATARGVESSNLVSLRTLEYAYDVS